MKHKIFTVLALLSTAFMAFFAHYGLTDYLQSSGFFEGSASAVAFAVVAAALPFMLWMILTVALPQRAGDKVLKWAIRLAAVTGVYVLALPWVIQALSGNNHISLIAAFWVTAGVIFFIAYKLRDLQPRQQAVA